MLIKKLIGAVSALFGNMPKLHSTRSTSSYRGPTAERRKRRNDNAQIRKDLGLLKGTPGNKLAVRAARRKISLSVIK